MSNIWNDPHFLLAISYWCRLFMIWRKRQHKKTRLWVRPINKNRLQQGDFMALFQELKDDTIMFFRYTRVTVNFIINSTYNFINNSTFYNLLELIAPALQKSHWRAISPEQRLSITLRYILISLLKFNYNTYNLRVFLYKRNCLSKINIFTKLFGCNLCHILY